MATESTAVAHQDQEARASSSSGSPSKQELAESPLWTSCWLDRRPDKWVCPVILSLVACPGVFSTEPGDTKGMISRFCTDTIMLLQKLLNGDTAPLVHLCLFVAMLSTDQVHTVMQQCLGLCSQHKLARPGGLCVVTATCCRLVWMIHMANGHTYQHPHR